ncbi:alpha/beta hydrolase family protein [Pontibacter sp. MBLB2868]|uniref:alpha/beta hydrolase family protein n=1 Tax=Pontibacter sp. MBLB2868 TaxID=3451555 RepID=UPI003F74D338
MLIGKQMYLNRQTLSERKSGRAVFLLFLLFLLSSPLHAFPLPLSLGQVEDSTALYRRMPINFQSGRYTLAGQLVVPRNLQGKVPAIVFCVGSSKESSVASYAPFVAALLENNLPLDSVALFYFDKRGVGASEGKWFSTDFEGRAADAKAAADYLKTLSYIDSERIAVVGHSQGGWITQVCLAQYPETFVGGISLAGPTFSVREQVRNDYASRLMCQEQLPETAAREKALRMVNRDFFLASLLPFKENWKQLKTIKRFDPAPYLTQVQRPLLLLFGENDALVSPAYALGALQQLFPQALPAHLQTVTVRGANHSFKVAAFCHAGTTRALPYSEESKRYIRDWVRLHLLQ